MILLATESLFLDKIQLVAGQPLTYVAFLILVLAWGLRWYFLRTERYLNRLRELPEAGRLSAFQLVILGFPENLTEGRLTVLRWRYLFAALVASLACLVILAGLLVHYLSMSPSDVNRRMGRIEDALKDQVKAIDNAIDSAHKDRGRIEDALKDQVKAIDRAHNDLQENLQLASQQLRTLDMKWTFHDVPLETRIQLNKRLEKAKQDMLQYQDLEDINASFDWVWSQRVIERSYALYPWLNYLVTGKLAARSILAILPLNSSSSVVLPFGQLVESGLQVTNGSLVGDEQNVAGGIEFQQETEIRSINPTGRKRNCINGFSGSVYVNEKDVVCWWSIQASSLKNMLDAVPQTGPVNATFPERIEVVVISKISDWPVQIDNVTNRKYWHNSDVAYPRPSTGGFAGKSELVLTPNNSKYQTRYSMKLIGIHALHKGGNSVGGGN
ncbi:MAG: hypothetical protein L0215_13985, partial [Gemmataceae bacterium]|nr:hypothetical protein [Gemmataceae bacterium]